MRCGHSEAMHDERLDVTVTFDPARGYIGSVPELKVPVLALSLGGIRRRVEALLLPDDVLLLADRVATAIDHA